MSSSGFAISLPFLRVQQDGIHFRKQIALGFEGKIGSRFAKMYGGFDIGSRGGLHCGLYSTVGSSSGWVDVQNAEGCERAFADVVSDKVEQMIRELSVPVSVCSAARLLVSKVLSFSNAENEDEASQRRARQVAASAEIAGVSSFENFSVARLRVEPFVSFGHSIGIGMGLTDSEGYRMVGGELAKDFLLRVGGAFYVGGKEGRMKFILWLANLSIEIVACKQPLSRTGGGEAVDSEGVGASQSTASVSPSGGEREERENSNGNACSSRRGGEGSMEEEEREQDSEVGGMRRARKRRSQGTSRSLYRHRSLPAFESETRSAGRRSSASFSSLPHCSPSLTPEAIFWTSVQEQIRQSERRQFSAGEETRPLPSVPCPPTDGGHPPVFSKEEGEGVHLGRAVETVSPRPPPLSACASPSASFSEVVHALLCAREKERRKGGEKDRAVHHHCRRPPRERGGVIGEKRTALTKEERGREEERGASPCVHLNNALLSSSSLCSSASSLTSVASSRQEHPNTPMPSPPFHRRRQRKHKHRTGACERDGKQLPPPTQSPVWSSREREEFKLELGIESLDLPSAVCLSREREGDHGKQEARSVSLGHESDNESESISSDSSGTSSYSSIEMWTHREEIVGGDGNRDRDRERASPPATPLSASVVPLPSSHPFSFTTSNERNDEDDGETFSSPLPSSSLPLSVFDDASPPPIVQSPLPSSTEHTQFPFMGHLPLPFSISRDALRSHATPPSDLPRAPEAKTPTVASLWKGPKAESLVEREGRQRRERQNPSGQQPEGAGAAAVFSFFDWQPS
uniref:Uncharacterized protein n=1 Tax=Chromera velia CCMP2878 TaxID=1169474 RepID=A0A0G4IET8_9ALVE|eukprot:Cvel_2428.t1-p1 / transcript=Cvel_2428.t1 / gene=Cvel_2428 / organism=Chromera_velia_CCMP2878 / gene_product=hypothetical protein / transcript_product=hypothetical protein / location=Cvel_scaffold95:22683-25304(+) / protein_length=802 / sequence_SO=supercontig / SO=protein_coding / is_pseudo=false